MISFRIDWFDLLGVQGTLKSLLQHHNLKASIFQHSAFFTVQLSYLYITTRKTTALTIWTSVGEVTGKCSPSDCSVPEWIWAVVEWCQFFSRDSIQEKTLGEVSEPRFSESFLCSLGTIFVQAECWSFQENLTPEI